ncbi:MAG TPA: hypothetical protein VF585_02845 [Chthoniobacterales bacterium]
MNHFSRFFPTLLVVAGVIWLSWLTYGTMLFSYYGWLPLVSDRPEDHAWSEKEVVEMFVAFGTEGRNRARLQFWPLVMIAAGTLIHAIRITKPK